MILQKYVFAFVAAISAATVASAAPPGLGLPTGLVKLKGVDLRAEAESYSFPPIQQGSRDTCTIFATTFLIEFMTVKARKYSIGPFSVEYENYAANAGSGHSGDGGYFEDVAEGYLKWGAVAESMAPYQATYDPSYVPGSSIASYGKNNRWLSPRMIRVNDGTYGLSQANIDAMIASLDAGVPVAGGFRISSLTKTKQVGDIVMWDEMPPVRDWAAHSMAIVGYQTSPEASGGGYFIIRNSDGPDSGDHGHLYASFDFVRKNVADVIVFDMLAQPVALTATVPSTIHRRPSQPTVTYATRAQVQAAVNLSRRVR
jgi:hypothetical protein